MRDVSLIALAIGPERVVGRTLQVAIDQAAQCGELVVVHDRDEDAARARLSGYSPEPPVRFVSARSTSPGAARNAGVRSSSCECFLIVDGSESLPAGHASNARRVLAAAPDASFAAAPGGALFGIVSTGPAGSGRIDDASLVGSPWSIGPALVRRQAFDEAGGFDESLAALVDWDFLLRLTGAGRTGVLMTGAGARAAEDDVRLLESIRPQNHLPAVRRIFFRHQAIFEKHMRTALVERERTAKALHQHERQLLERRSRTMADLRAAQDRLAALKPALDRHGQRTIDFADLRRTTPLSRNWGSERGLSIDRHYIHRFMAEHAGDVHGQVLEMLDDQLTTTYGRDRVHRSDVLDIDPGNPRATLIGDLRVAEQLPADTYDCFILTQTLHLVDDISAALRNAYRLLKPGGVLLATLPCASMVATEYGPDGDHWRVTKAGARVLFERVFEPADLEIRSHGNVLTLAAFLYGLCCEDLDPQELANDDPAYPLLIAVRARRPAPVVRVSGLAPKPVVAAAVLRYHRVADVPRDIHGLAVSRQSFRSQIEHLCQSWRILPLRTLAAAAAAGEPPERGIALTFDDGYVDNLDVAAPILAEFGVAATFFLGSESPGAPRRFWWDALEEALLGSDSCPGEIDLRIRGERQSFLTSDPTARHAAHGELYRIFKSSAPSVRDDMLAQLARQTSVSLVSEAHRPVFGPEVRRLEAFPLIEVGAHGVHHVSLAQLSADECHREVFESRSSLERLTGRPVASFAYPFGDVSTDAVTTVMAAGFQIGVTCDARGLRAREHPFRIPRLPTCEESGSELGARLDRVLGV